MTYQIVCPSCKKTIDNYPIIEEAAKGEGLDSQSIICDCSKRITYWRITAQLRDQKKLGSKIQHWIKSRSRSGSSLVQPPERK